MQRVRPAISEKVRMIHDKLEKRETLSRNEKALEVTKDEAAYLLSKIAGRDIKADYLKQLTRGDNPRLPIHRSLGNTYTYLVGDLLGVRFTKPHKKKEVQHAEQRTI